MHFLNLLKKKHKIFQSLLAITILDIMRLKFMGMFDGKIFLMCISAKTSYPLLGLCPGKLEKVNRVLCQEILIWNVSIMKLYTFGKN